MHRAVAEVHEERFRRVGGLGASHHLDRPIGDVVGEVVVVGVGVDVHRRVAVDQSVGLVQVGEAVEKPVEAIEPTLGRPGVERPGIGAVAVLGQVPLAHHGGEVARIGENLGGGGHVIGQLHGIAGKPGIGVGHMAHPGQMRVDAGEQRRPGRRTHRGGVVVGEPQRAGGQRIQVGGGDLRAVATQVGVPQVVGHDHDHVGGALGCGGLARPPRVGPGHRAARPSLEVAVRTGGGVLAHLSPPSIGSLRLSS